MRASLAKKVRATSRFLSHKSKVKYKNLIRVLALGAFGIVLVVALRFLTIKEPHTQIGSVIFISSYTLSSDKNSTLQGYAANISKYNGGYIPKQVDKFLCSKLQNSTSGEELAAILDFYAFKAGGREGRYIYLLPAQTKQRIVGLVLNRLDNYTLSQATSALILVEVVRRGQYLSKARFSSKDISIDKDALSYPEYRTWWEQYRLPEAKERFRKWWRAYPSWQQKEKHDPLKYSNFVISAL